MSFLHGIAAYKIEKVDFFFVWKYAFENKMKFTDILLRDDLKKYTDGLQIYFFSFLLTSSLSSLKFKKCMRTVVMK